MSTATSVVSLKFTQPKRLSILCPDLQSRRGQIFYRTRIAQNFRDSTLVTDCHWSLGRSGLSNNLDLFVNGIIEGCFSLEAQSADAKTYDSFVVDQNVSRKSIYPESPLHLAIAIAVL